MVFTTRGRLSSMLASVVVFTFAVPCQEPEKQQLENTVKRLESKLDRVDGYLKSLESQAEQDPQNPREQELERRVAELEAALGEARQEGNQAQRTASARQTEIERLRQAMKQARTRAAEQETAQDIYTCWATNQLLKLKEETKQYRTKDIPALKYWKDPWKDNEPQKAQVSG